MGKRNRKTRWRTLTMADEHSDSEESTTTSGPRLPKGYQPKSYYGRFTYSSQSTPTRRYQYDGTKSTRSSSTASENKITFNEDEYTRITTPRQDVLFKKGYLNKPKNYQTQTSTGTSTTSTGNSTGNGTPDHQSTDLDYESSQFVFPNGFVDQNGIYYVNSFEPYPLMLYNPPTYYPEFTDNKSKRCSTGSLTESTSPNNEEVCQELSQSEAPSNVSDFNPVYNVVYPGYYFNNSGGECQSQDATDESRRSKKTRRKSSSRSTSATSDSSEEVSSDESSKEEKETVDAQQMLLKSLVKENGAEAAEESVIDDDCPKLKYDLKPDAEEFVPRAYRQPETIPVDPNLQFIKLPPNFVPVPILNPLDEFNGQNFNHPAFMQPGIPINFIPQNYVNFATNYEKPKENEEQEEAEEEKEEEENVKEEEKTVVVPKVVSNQTNRIDIAKIVSKLEEAAKEQDEEKGETKKEEIAEEKPATRSLNRKSFDRNLRRNRYQNNKNEEDRTKNNVEWKKPSWKQTNSSPRRETNKTASNGLPPKIPTKNYSETLKKPLTAKPPKTVAHPKKEETTLKNEPPKSPNQWISVSNRKKRRSRNIEETEDIEELDDSDLFESYDVSLLQDVVVETKQIEKIPEVKIEAIAETETVTPKEEVKKKKSKKGSKVASKRVIIKDADLSLEKEVVVEEKKEETVETVVVEEVAKPVEEKKIEITEKKTKNKKKKNKMVVKPELFNSQSSSSTTLNVLDDSYDFLLETSILDESERTNVEISQELDKMIQRGMYSSLEEKFKSLNMVETNNDGFFKTIISNISSREPSVEKNNYMKTPDFTKILKNTVIPKPVILETDPAGSVGEVLISESGDFLEEIPPPLEEVKIIDSIESKKETKHEEPKDEKLYPITQAVKNWMTKTRENTPEVEILKSPSTIFKEFCLEANENVIQQPKSRSNSVASSLHNDNDEIAEDEITIFSKENGDDLLEYWEDDFVKTIEQGEDVLVYESKYGKNEDFLRIKKEVEEKKINYPKHGNLPYRAICCSIM